MPSRSSPATVLVVESDVTLGQVLSRVLARDGSAVVHATHAEQALELAHRHTPRLVVLRNGWRDRQALELAEELRRHQPDLRAVVLTDEPADELAAPADGRCVTRVLGQSVDLHELRQAVDEALRAEDAPVRSVSARARPAGSNLFAVIARELPMGILRSTWLRATGLILAGLVMLAGVAMATGAVPVPWPPARAGKPAAPPTPAVTAGVELVKGQPHTLQVPEDVLRTLGIRKGNTDLIAEAKKPTKMRPLVMPGSTALDPTRLMRIRARFAPSPSSAEVVEIGQVAEDPRRQPGQPTAFRELRSGDKVRKGDLLAVFYSVDVGNKKNDLIDAIYQRTLDEEILKRAEANAASVPEVFILNARRNLQGDLNAINRAVNTLKTWGIPEEAIQAVRDEAEEVKKRGGKHDKTKDALWARVEIRAPDDGVIIERNVALHEIVVDNTTNLFQIAKVDKLTVFANVPEDGLPVLEALPSDLRLWTVKTVGSEPIAGFIDDIGYLIDPSQHTAVVKGHIDNKDGKLRAGQFISAAVALPPPLDVVEIPTDAVVDDGQQCVVFVADPEKHTFTLRRVQLTYRFDKTVFVRSKPFAKGTERTAEEAELGLLPREPLHPGDRVLTTAVGELKAALLEKESQPEKK